MSPALLCVSSLTLGTGLVDSPGHGEPLSPAFANLIALAQLVIYLGRISGSIPPQISNLHRLIFLSVTNNLISGPIPDSLSAFHQVFLSRSCQRHSERQETQFKPISFCSEIAVDRTRWCICRPYDEKGKNSEEKILTTSYKKTKGLATVAFVIDTLRRWQSI
ncbi:hypothetical protein MRB53_016945 [Persea americana]|uniref:Uncharacterized protein n=1 Tax=Persea americana TaxID=3435 RepID=A0ACC2M4J1_PERAE|nr:hypothetical protein MRB53_016945 [Persea americana]